MKIAAVVVSYRRRHLLAGCVRSLLRQTRPLDGIVIVDNEGDPELSTQLATEFGEAVTCLTMASNGGPAGGFAAGSRWAAEHGFGWAWLMDDDCEALPDSLEKLVEVAAQFSEPPAALSSCHLTLAGRPVGTGSGHFDWRYCRLRLLDAEKCASGIHPVDSISSSGMFLNLDAARRAGFQDPDLFWLEDTDFSWRLSRVGRLFHVGDSRIFRKVEEETWTYVRHGYARPPAATIWRTYYVMRNDARFYLRARPGLRTWSVLLYRYLHAIAGVLILDDRKLWRMRWISRAMFDGVRGRLGKTVDPPHYLPARPAARDDFRVPPNWPRMQKDEHQG